MQHSKAKMDFWLGLKDFFKICYSAKKKSFWSTRSLYNLWHLEKFRARLHGIWNSAKFTGDQSKKSPCSNIILVKKF